MCKKITWTLIDPLFHGFQYLTSQDIIYYHIEYNKSDFHDPNNSWVNNYKKGIEHRQEKQWYYKEKAISDFANLLINTPFQDKDNRLLLSAPPSKRRDSPAFDSRNDDVLNIVHKKTNIPISFNLYATKDIAPTHAHSGYRNPENLRGLYSFVPFENIPKIVYIVDDVITSGSHFIVWRDLIHQAHPDIEVRGFYLARTINARNIL